MRDWRKSNLPRAIHRPSRPDADQGARGIRPFHTASRACRPSLLVKESEGGRDLARDDIRALLHSLVDVVVQMRRIDGRFRMTEVWYEPVRKRALAA